MDDSPIRTLSEDRRHVSLRLGPMVDSEETILDDLPLPRRLVTTNQTYLKAQGKKKTSKPSTSRKRAVQSPLQGVSIKKRRISKALPSPRRRLVPNSGADAEPAAGTSRTARPQTNIIPATTRRGADFRTAPKSLL